MMCHRSVLSAFIALLLLLPGTAGVAAETVLNPIPYYIDTESLPPQLLPPPPNEGTREERKQIDGVLAAQKNVSAADLAAIKDEQHLRLDLMTSVLGDAFTRDKYPKTFSLLDHVLADAGQICEADKKFWHTRRPYLVDHHVKLYIDSIDSSPSYPSGHTSDTLVLAEVLGMLKPDKLSELRARADAIAVHRIEAGAHFPNDIEGGRRLGLMIVGALASNDDFQDDIVAARKEISAK